MRDLIYRQAALSEIDGFLAMDKHYHPHSQGKTIPVDEMRARLKNLPSAKPLYENITELKEHLERILASCSTEGDYNEGFADGLSLYIDELEQFENKAQQKPQWIPVTERLPEKNGLYLTWMRFPYEEEPTWTIENYDADVEAFGEWRERYHPETLGDLDSEFEEIENVMAWMPLPKPFREDGGE